MNPEPTVTQSGLVVAGPGSVPNLGLDGARPACPSLLGVGAGESVASKSMTQRRDARQVRGIALTAPQTLARDATEQIPRRDLAMKPIVRNTRTPDTASAPEACASAPQSNPQLERARYEHLALQADPRARNDAGHEIRRASDALRKAETAWRNNASEEEVHHLAYLASQHVAIARSTMDMKTAEAMVQAAAADRSQHWSQVRLHEANGAQHTAATQPAEQVTQTTWPAPAPGPNALERNRQDPVRVRGSTRPPGSVVR